MVLGDRVPGSAAKRAGMLVVAALVIVGCSGGTSASATPGPASDGKVGATLTEFKIELAASSAPAGPVTFNLNNTGTIVHEFVVFKTDLAADKLPMSADGATVDEAGGGGALTLINEVEDIAAKATPALAVDLAAGNYIVICNIEGHYIGGMRAAFKAN